jgi:putative GTP pyrophosphokinase
MASEPSMPESDKKSHDHSHWLNDTLPKHELLATAAKMLLENMLKKQRVEHLSVTSRVKTFDGAVEKIGRKGYNKPEEQLTDLSGIRIVTYLEEQVDQISQIIRDLFEIDEKNSLDRSEILGDDKVGYRSTHFVCTLGKKREGLLEYQNISDLKFEIQVRTVLQHAWAELAHDRSFKFGAALPTKIQRKLNLYSGLLEIVDSAFDEISKEVDLYEEGLSKKTVEQISGIELNSLSIDRYLKQLNLRLDLETEVTSNLIDELKNFGVSTVGDLSKLVTPEFLTAHKEFKWTFQTTRGFLRSLMMYNDMEKYLTGPYKWNRLESDTFEFLAKKIGKERLLKILSPKKLGVLTAQETLDNATQMRVRNGR